MVIIKKLQEAINKRLPSGVQLVDMKELAQQVNEFLNDKYELYGRMKEVDNTTFAPVEHIYRGQKITATGENAKKLIEFGWFSKEEITEKELDKAVGKTAEAIVPLAIRFQRSYRESTPEQIRLAQDACYARMRTDPIFNGAVRYLVVYTVGNGVEISSQSPEIDKVIKANRKLNNFDEETSLENIVAFRHFLEGEQFWITDVDAITGDCLFSRVETYEVTNWEYHPKFRDIIIAYEVFNDGKTFWIADYRYFDEYYNSKTLLNCKSAHHSVLNSKRFLFHAKENIYPEFRGRPIATAALRYFKYAEDFLYDRIILNHERSRVVWIRTILGRGANSLANYMAAPPGGVMLNQTEDIKYDTVNSEIHADDVKEDYLSILYAIASCFMMPIHVLNMRSSEQVYASVLSAKAPFTKAILTWQDFFSRVMNKIDKIVVREKIKAGKLPAKVKVISIVNGKEVEETVDTIDVEIIHTFPNPIDEKLTDRTLHEKFLIDYGVASRRTIREDNGFDNEREIFRINQEASETDSLPIVKLKPGQNNPPQNNPADTNPSDTNPADTNPPQDTKTKGNKNAPK